MVFVYVGILHDTAGRFRHNPWCSNTKEQYDHDQ
jgi:hypothetical protein